MITDAPARQRTDDPFTHWWELQGEWVEAPNQRRGGQSGVQQIAAQGDIGQRYLKRQEGHLYRSWLYPFGRPTVLRERDALMALQQLGIGVPTLVYCQARKGADGWRALLVTEALENFVSLEDWYADDAPTRWGEAVHQAMLEQLAATLAHMHQAGWQHGCCYAKHVFIRVNDASAAAPVEIALLDLEKSRRRWHRQKASRHDMAQLKRHRGAMPDADWQALEQFYRQATR